MARFDTLLKDLILGAAPALLGQLTGSTVREWLNAEQPETRNRRVDLAGWLADGRLLHLELQSTNDPWMAHRMLEYYLLLWQRYAAEPEQFVLYVGADPSKMTQGLTHRNLWTRYRLVDIRDLPPEPLLDSERMGDAVLAVLCRMENERETVIRILSRIAALPRAERPRWVSRLMLLSGLRRLEKLVVEEAKSMPVVIDPMENSVLRQWWFEAHDKGREEGLRNALRQLLEARFGELSPAILDRVNHADSHLIEDWIPRVLTAASLDDVFRAA